MTPKTEVAPEASQAPEASEAPGEGSSSPSYLANLREYWREHLVHLGVGGFAGLMLTAGEPWAGAVIMATVWVRQGLEYQKRLWNYLGWFGGFSLRTR